MTSNLLIEESLKALEVAPVVEGLRDDKACALDFTPNNQRLAKVDVADTAVFEEFVWKEMDAQGATYGTGGYGEWREIYRRSSLFDGTETPRNIHLGVDIWASAGLAVYSPIEGKVHSFKNNEGFGNYGGTVVLKHHLPEGYALYSLYGHLGTGFIQTLESGKQVRAGEKVGDLGGYEENGHWPPHLHFQLMTDLEGNVGDYPGVCATEDRDHYLSVCPNPNLLLRLSCLN